MSEVNNDSNKNNSTQLNRNEITPHLENLIKIRGKTDGLDAIVAFAHRCALRNLPLYGQNPIKATWRKQPYWYFFTIIRAHQFTLLWLDSDIEKDKLKDAAADAYEAANKEPSAVANAANTAYTACDGDIAYTANAAQATVNAAHSIADTAMFKDYKYLQNKDNAVTELLFQPLWWKQIPVLINKTQQKLIQELNKDNLTPIANDIEAMLNGKFKPEDAQKYQVNISQIDIQTADDLNYALLSYQNEEKATVKNNAIRALLIGPGGAGKSTLAELIRKGKVNANKKPTLGVEHDNHEKVNLAIHEKRLTRKAKQLSPDIYLWDFGGQAIYHSLHHAFMHENCVYIVVIDSRHEQAPEPWLHQIQITTRNRAKVLVVTNWFDGIKIKQNRNRLIRQFPHLLDKTSFYDFSCHNAKSAGFEQFINQLIIKSSESSKEMLSETKKALDLLNRLFSDKQVIYHNVLKGTLQRAFPRFTAEKLTSLMYKLKGFGRYIELGDKKHKSDEDRLLCLNPDWTVKIAYRLVNLESTQKAGGIIGNNKNENLKMDNVIDFMCQHGVSIPINDGTYFIPDAATIDEPLAVKQLLTRQKIVTLYYELLYLPLGLRAKVATELINEYHIDNVKEKVWRDGFIAKNNLNNESCVVVEYQASKNRIFIHLVGELKDCAPLLNIVDQSLLKGTSANELSGISDRDIIGYPIIDESKKHQNELNQTENKNMNQIYNELIKLVNLKILRIGWGVVST